MIDSKMLEILKNVPEFKRTRFAPSPTGYLHLGHVLSATFVWLIARLRDAEVLLRIEDHDTSRCRDVYIKSIYDDLQALGFHADLGRDSDGSTFRQTKHQYRYDEMLSQLKTYFCSCTRNQIMTRNRFSSHKKSEIVLAKPLNAVAAHGDQGEALSPELLSSSSMSRNHSWPDGSLGLISFHGNDPSQGDFFSRESFYDRYCQERRITEGALRLRSPSKATKFYDHFLQQDVEFTSETAEDFLLRERNGNYSYQFCVVVDDFQEGVDMVIRGQDLLASTGNQILLHESLGNQKPPVFFHHPLLTDESGKKLSKRFFSESVQSLLAKGIKPEAILGKVCAIVGLWPDNRSVSFEELVEFYKIKLAEK